MRLLVGTSGFAYKAWKGRFYPKDLKDKDFLSYYGQRFKTVEINNTFYRMPKREVLEHWCQSVPEDFVFVLKAPRQITHIKRLKDVAQPVAYFVEQCQAAGSRLGPVLVQTPNSVRCDLERLDAFLALVPAGLRLAFEFRHESWFSDEVLCCLRAHNAALVAMDSDHSTVAGAGAGVGVGEASEMARVEGAGAADRAWQDLARQLRSTSDFGYLRLRGCAYSDEDLSFWLNAVRAQSWREVFIFFKHEDEGAGPLFASRLLALSGAPGSAPT
ncbi:MAG: DUF72 domain-containing protein [Deltaproteobacteria bacterium]|nr:DUF72 domain-containing protein [Deltaproteobacteria bacterium]